MELMLWTKKPANIRAMSIGASSKFSPFGFRGFLLGEAHRILSLWFPNFSLYFSRQLGAKHVRFMVTVRALRRAPAFSPGSAGRYGTPAKEPLGALARHLSPFRAPRSAQALCRVAGDGAAKAVSQRGGGEHAGRTPPVTARPPGQFAESVEPTYVRVPQHQKVEYCGWTKFCTKL